MNKIPRQPRPFGDYPVFLKTVEQLTGIKGISEFRFHFTRNWRADYAWPGKKLLVEIEGGAFSSGGHVRGAGFRDNLEKYNAAAMDGWTVLRFLPEQVESGHAANMTIEFLTTR